MKFHHHVLDNGLAVVGEFSPAARSAALGFFVKAGSRDEDETIAGTSHFLEHMVFKGTERRSALDVNRDFDKIGASYNASTSEENTIFYAAILPEYLPDAADLLADILRPSLRVEDFTLEKKVILEEIGMYEDQPAWCAYDLARKNFFGAHPLGNTVLGTTASIRKLSRDQMYDYFKGHYRAGNITAVVTGRFSWPKMVALLEKHCGSWPAGTTPRRHVREAPAHASLQVVNRRKSAQENVCLVAPGPAADSPLRHAADILSMIVGDDSGSRLHWALVDPGLTDSADLGYHEYHGAGVFLGSFSCDPKRTNGNLEIYVDVLRRLQLDGVTEEELAQAKSKILSRLVRSAEKPMGRFHAVGAAWQYLGKYRSLDDELKAYEAVTRKRMQQLLERYPVRDWTVLALGPLRRVHSNGVASR